MNADIVQQKALTILNSLICYPAHFKTMMGDPTFKDAQASPLPFTIFPLPPPPHPSNHTLIAFSCALGSLAPS